MRLAATLLCFIAWMPISGTAIATGNTDENKALRDVFGVVKGTSESIDSEGVVWVHMDVTTRQGEIVPVRVAPLAVMQSQDVRFEDGDRVRLRLFVGDSPVDASRVRNLDSGRTLRLRRLHGQPIWDRSTLGPSSRPQAHRGKRGGPKG